MVHHLRRGSVRLRLLERERGREAEVPWPRWPREAVRELEIEAKTSDPAWAREVAVRRRVLAGFPPRARVRLQLQVERRRQQWGLLQSDRPSRWTMAVPGPRGV